MKTSDENFVEVDCVVLVADGHPDSTGECIPMEGVSIAPVVPLTRNFDHRVRLGLAKLRKDDVYVRAQFKFPSDKLPEFPLWPAIGGKVLEAGEPQDGKRVLTKVEITEVALSASPNQDPRVPPIQGAEWYSAWLVAQHGKTCFECKKEITEPHKRCRFHDGKPTPCLAVMCSQDCADKHDGVFHESRF